MTAREPTTMDGSKIDEPPGELSLLVIESEATSTQPLPTSGTITIGRGPEAGVRVSDPLVSRQHARVHVRPGGAVEIEDLTSQNGTRLGNVALPPGHCVPIQLGELVALGTGGTMLVVRHLPGQGRLRRMQTHEYFDARLEEECARAQQPGATFSVVRLHVDGDMAPAALADTLAPRLRPLDVVAIYAPNEYELLLSATPRELASAITHDLTSLLNAHGLRARTGIAGYPRDGTTPEGLIALACDRVRPSTVVEAGGTAEVIVEDEAMRNLYSLAGRIAAGTLPVLIVGETGVGKEVIAEAIHRMSPRARAPFVCLNCAALPDGLLESELFGHERGAFTGATEAKLGLLESAPGGTVFLDEIGEMRESAQAKLLRVLEKHEVVRVGSLKTRAIDVRFVSATNKNLEQEVTAGRFRSDLYYRLKGAVLDIPPLRARRGEILPLARSFATRSARSLGRETAPAIAHDAEMLLLHYTWPGNIRELRNVIERAVLLSTGDEITPEHLPSDVMTTNSAPAAPPARATPAAPLAHAPAGSDSAPLLADDGGQDTRRASESERDRIIRVLAECVGNQTRAALQLGIARSTLVERLELYAIPRPRKRQTVT